jgi:hypothetical protein
MTWRCFLLASAITAARFSGAAAAEDPGSNDHPLRGIKGYRVDRLMGPPSMMRELGFEPAQLKATLESRLKAAGLYLRPDESGLSPSVLLWVSVTPPQDGWYSWYVRIEVREQARLERVPDAGALRVSSWEQTIAGMAPLAEAPDRLQHDFDRSVDALLDAHKTGGQHPPW